MLRVMRMEGGYCKEKNSIAFQKFVKMLELILPTEYQLIFKNIFFPSLRMDVILL